MSSWPMIIQINDKKADKVLCVKVYKGHPPFLSPRGVPLLDIISSLIEIGLTAIAIHLYQIQHIRKRFILNCSWQLKIDINCTIEALPRKKI